MNSFYDKKSSFKNVGEIVSIFKFKIDGVTITAIEQQVLDTNAGKQLSKADIDV
jgi:hypothetical protein